ncbi:MAG: hypothetical protein ACTSYI_12515 [Promethearchaeota archaeon]
MITLSNQFPNFKVLIAQMHEIFESTAIFNQEDDFPHKLFQIPIVNLTCDLADFQHLWRQIYHIIMNTNGNAIDLIVDGDHKIIFASLLLTTEEGNFLAAESLPVGDLPISDIQQLPLMEIFEKISPWIKKQHKIEIGNVRVYSDEFLREIDTLIGNGMLHSDNFIDQVFSLSTLLFQACGSLPESNLLFDCFPSTAFSQFLSSLKLIFDGKSLPQFKDQIIGFLKGSIPQIKSTISFQVNGNYFSYLVDNRKGNYHLKYLPKFDSNYDNGENPIIQRNQYLREVAHKQKISWNRFVDHAQVIRLLEAVLHSPFPLNLSRIELLLQMYLEYYRAYQFQWDMYPTPAIFNEQLRYAFNAVKIPLNLRKIAYWKAPRFIIKNCLQNVGINGNILVVFGSKFEELLQKSSTSPEKSFFALKIQLSKGEIKKIELLSGKDLKNGKKADSIEGFFQDLRVNMSSSTDFINSLYWISSDMVRTWWRVFNYEIFSSKLGGWRKLKSLVGMMKNTENFGVSPKTNLYSHMMGTKSGKFLKELLPLLIELREF